MSIVFNVHPGVQLYISDPGAQLKTFLPFGLRRDLITLNATADT